MKKKTTLMLAVVLLLSLVGCGHTVGDMDFEAGQSAIYIQEGGEITYGTAEKFDKDYYDKGDLEDKIDEEVAEYNNGDEASVNDAIEVEDFDVDNNVATMVLNFATTYDFQNYVHDFNNIDKEKFYIGSIDDNSDCEIKGDFVTPDKKKKCTAKEIKQLKDANILIVNEVYKVQSDYKVLYMSDNCTVNDDGIITTVNADKGTSYIVYSNELND